MVYCRIFIRSWSLIARWTCNDFSLPAVAHDFYEACFIDHVSRGSKLYLFFTSQYCTIFADLCIVSVSRFWRAKILVHVKYYVLFLHSNWVHSYKFFSHQNRLSTYAVNSLTAIGGPDRQLFFELRARVVSPRIFVRSQSLIARWTRNDFSLPAVSRDFYEALLIGDVSRGSKSYLFCAS